MKSSSFFRAAVAALVFSAACGDSTGPAIQLTEDQTEDMMEAFSLITSQGLDQTGGTGALNVGMLIINHDIEASGPCPEGGTFTLNGTGSTNTDTEMESGSFTQNFSGCKATSSAGRQWTFDGDPNITTSYSFSYNTQAETATWTTTTTGAFKATSDIGSGRCAINYTMTLSFGPDSFTGNVDGSVCGRDIEVDLSVEDPGVANAMRKMKR